MKIGIGCIALAFATMLSLGIKESVPGLRRTDVLKTNDGSAYTPGLTFDLSEDGTYYIVSNRLNQLSDGNVVIPETYNSLPVKEILSEGFAERTWIRSVSIPKTIEIIGSGAFSQTSLEKVYFNAENCRDFNARNWVFYPSSQQKIALTIGKDCKRIPSRMFFPLSTVPSLTPNVTSVTFEEGATLEEIGDYAFYHLDGFSSVQFPDSLKKIGKYAFYGNGLTALVLPDSLNEIGAHSFDDSRLLESVRFSENLEKIEEGAFRFCSRLNEIVLPASIKEIGKDAFRYCGGLQSADLNATEIIGESAFEDCVSLQTIAFDHAMILADRAFKNCGSLTSLNVPAGLKELGDQAFYGLSKVETVNFLSSGLNDLSPNNQVFSGLGKETEGTEVTIGRNVSSVPERLFFSSSSFEDFPNIAKIVLYSGNLVSIGDNAFAHLDAEVVYYGTISSWLNVEIGYGNEALATVDCRKEGTSL